MVPGVILEEAVISEATVRGDEFLSINRIWPSYSPRPIPFFPPYVYLRIAYALISVPS